MFSKLIKRGALVVALGAAIACGASPEADPSASEGADLTRAPLCNPSVCNASCTEQLGVPSGQCIGSACLCAAPTCGTFAHAPCPGNRCSQGNYDAAAGVCDDCGLSGATCCDRGHPGATTSCSAGLFCQDGITCRECGADGQDQCQSANGAPFCDPGLVLATNQGNGTPLECVSSCGAIGELPCADGGCNDQDATVNPGSPLCQWRKDCGSENQGCCDQGSEFQGGNCHDGSICRYEADFPGTGSWWCRAPCGCYPD
jgi:hypothetical protein